MTRRTLQRLLLASLLATTLPLLSACDDGPAEQAGEAVDETVEKAGEAVENLGEKVQEATE